MLPVPSGGFDAFLDRQGSLSTVDIVAGALLLLLVLEATRRTTGWILPVICAAFIGYAYYGGFLPQNWGIAHAGVHFSQILTSTGRLTKAAGFQPATLVGGPPSLRFLVPASQTRPTAGGLHRLSPLEARRLLSVQRRECCGPR
ncbi:hypothetical protein [Saccharopolyspora pogona]|uniref:hypothetical protein n=1 Tax=Saccharopolyspora pogona TaxID=333966 RepID=UPI001CC2458A|nr:hypothetical protein [Saccharopolyspora pogona]